MNIQEIKQRAEDDERFREYKNKAGVTFEDDEVFTYTDNSSGQ